MWRRKECAGAARPGAAPREETFGPRTRGLGALIDHELAVRRRSRAEAAAIYLREGA